MLNILALLFSFATFAAQSDVTEALPGISNIYRLHHQSKDLWPTGEALQRALRTFEHRRLDEITQGNLSGVFFPLIDHSPSPFVLNHPSRLTMLNQALAERVSVMDSGLAQLYKRIAHPETTWSQHAQWAFAVDLWSYCSQAPTKPAALLMNNQEVFLIYEAHDASLIVEPFFNIGDLDLGDLDLEDVLPAEHSYVEDMLMTYYPTNEIIAGGSFLQNKVKFPFESYEAVNPETLRIKTEPLFDKNHTASRKHKNLFDLIHQNKWSKISTHIYTDSRVVNGVLFMLHRTVEDLKKKSQNKSSLSAKEKELIQKIDSVLQKLDLRNRQSYTLKDFMQKHFPYTRYKL